MKSHLLKLSKEELAELYDVQFNPDGSVFDVVENRKFRTIALWVAFIEEQENGSGTFKKIGRSSYSEDDYDY